MILAIRNEERRKKNDFYSSRLKGWFVSSAMPSYCSSGLLSSGPEFLRTRGIDSEVLDIKVLDSPLFAGRINSSERSP